MAIIIMVIIIMAIIIMAVATFPIMPAMFATNVMTVNPMTPFPVAGDPNHFIVPIPITGAVAVVRPVAYLNAKALRWRNGRKKNTGRNGRDEKKFFRNHIG
jgi:hypothetical protein